MSIGMLKGRSQPGSVVAQPGSVLQHVPVVDAPQCRGAKKTIVVKLKSSMAGHVTRPSGANDHNGKPILEKIGEYTFAIGQYVRFPADEAERMILKGLASAVADAN